MGKFDGILLISDLDNTILGHTNKISEKNFEAITYFTSQGGLFTMATGRTLGSLMQFFRPGIINAPVITSNGAVICDPETNKQLWSLNLDKESGIRLIEYTDEHAPFAACEIYGPDAVYLHRTNAVAAQHMEYEQFEIKKLPLTHVPEPWHKVVFAQETEETDRLIEVIKDAPLVSEFQFVRSWTKFYEMVHKDTGKGRALKELAAILKLSLKNVVAVGDYYNDMDMIEAAGVGVAVLNAAPELKDAAKYVTQNDCENDAISEVIEKLENGEWEIT